MNNDREKRKRYDGPNSRRKGRNFELEIVRVLAALTRTNGEPLFPDVHRGIQSRGAEAADVVIPWFWLECKRGRRPNVRKAFAQASADATGPGKVPVVISRADQERTMVTMDLSDWTDMLVRFFESELADE